MTSCLLHIINVNNEYKSKLYQFKYRKVPLDVYVANIYAVAITRTGKGWLLADIQ